MKLYLFKDRRDKTIGTNMCQLNYFTYLRSMTSITKSATSAPIMIKMFGRSASVIPVDPMFTALSPVYHDSNTEHSKLLEGIGVRMSSHTSRFVALFESLA